MKNMCGIDLQLRAGYRAPLGRGNIFVVCYPARWAGLRDVGPLGQNTSAGLNRRQFSASCASFLSPAQRPGSSSAQNSCGIKGRDTRRAHRPPRAILKTLGQLVADIQQGMKELEGMLK